MPKKCGPTEYSPLENLASKILFVTSSKQLTLAEPGVGDPVMKILAAPLASGVDSGNGASDGVV